MPRIRPSRSAILLVILAVTARGDETSPPEPPTVALPNHYPISRSSTTASPGSTASSSSSGFWLSTGGVVVALAAFGFVSLGARKLRPGPENGSIDVKIIGRASLSPRQSVVLLRAGNRVLIVGAGGQGPPSLLGELIDNEETLASSSEKIGGSS